MVRWPLLLITYQPRRMTGALYIKRLNLANCPSPGDCPGGLEYGGPWCEQQDQRQRGQCPRNHGSRFMSKLATDTPAQTACHTGCQHSPEEQARIAVPRMVEICLGR